MKHMWCDFIHRCELSRAEHCCWQGDGAFTPARSPAQPLTKAQLLLLCLTNSYGFRKSF